MQENKSIKVLIGIQARSNSTRFPQKIYQTIGRKMVIQHVIEQAKSAKVYVERNTHKTKIKCEVAVLHPKNDLQLISSVRSSCSNLIESPSNDENNVLSRYSKAMDQEKADYIVRITSDCPMILDFIISKHINVAVFNSLDYVSNVFEEMRLAFDGLDVEVISRRAMDWLIDNVRDQDDREHVTTKIRKDMPLELSYGFITSKLDTSRIKMSLDTPDDLERIREYYHQREHKLNLAVKTFGRKNLYEI